MKEYTENGHKTTDGSTATLNGNSNGKQRQFVKIYSDIILEYGAKMQPIAFACYVYLCMRADSKTRKCWPGLGRMAKELGITRSAVRSGLKRLEELGLIRIEHRHKDKDKRTWDSNMYTVLEGPEGMSMTQGYVNDIGGMSIAEGYVNDPELDSVELDSVVNQCVKETQLVRETENTPPTEIKNPTGFAGDHDNRHEEDVSKDFGSSRSSEASENTPSPQAPAPPLPEAQEWAECALRVVEKGLDKLDLAPLDGRERKQFLRKFEELRREREIDNKTAYAVIRRIFERWPKKHLSPDYAYEDVLEDPDKYHPMADKEWVEWIKDYLNGQDSEDGVESNALPGATKMGP